jgi:hypothetical protein
VEFRESIKAAIPEIIALLRVGRYDKDVRNAGAGVLAKLSDHGIL